MSRYFICRCGTIEHIIQAQRPKQAANKMFTILTKGSTLDEEKIIFEVKDYESEKAWMYCGIRKKLKKPSLMTLPNGLTIEYHYTTNVDKIGIKVKEKKESYLINKENYKINMKLISELDGSYYDNIIIMNEERKLFQDVKVKNEYKLSGLNVINKFKTLKFNRNNELESTIMKYDHIVKVRAYDSDSDILLYIKSSYDDNDTEYIMLLSENEFVIVGNVGSHPLIHTDKFVYDNSDGSGPENLVKVISVNNLLVRAKKYYVRFCNDSYH